MIFNPKDKKKKDKTNLLDFMELATHKINNRKRATQKSFLTDGMVTKKKNKIKYISIFFCLFSFVVVKEVEQMKLTNSQH